MSAGITVKLNLQIQLNLISYSYYACTTWYKIYSTQFTSNDSADRKLYIRIGGYGGSIKGTFLNGMLGMAEIIHFAWNIDFCLVQIQSLHKSIATFFCLRSFQ